MVDQRQKTNYVRLEKRREEAILSYSCLRAVMVPGDTVAMRQQA